MKQTRNYARIHILKKEAGLTAEEYKKLLAEFGAASATELSEDDYKQACATLEGRCKHLHQAVRGSARARDAERVKSRQERYFWALWYKLKPYLPQGDRNAEYLAGFAGKALSRYVGLDRGHLDFEDLDSREKHKLIDALKERISYEEERLAAVPF